MTEDPTAQERNYTTSQSKTATRSSWWGAALIVAVGAGSYWLGARQVPAVVGSNTTSDSAHQATTKTKGSPSVHRSDVREAVARAVSDEVSQINDESALNHYLATLRARALAKHEVTALEVETGIAAIDRLRERLGQQSADDKIRAFSAEMTEISQQKSHYEATQEKHP